MESQATSLPKSTEHGLPPTLLSTAPLESYLDNFSAHVRAEFASLKHQVLHTTSNLNEVRSAAFRIQKYLLEKMPQVEKSSDMIIEYFSLLNTNAVDGAIDVAQQSNNSSTLIMDREDGKGVPGRKISDGSSVTENQRMRITGPKGVINEEATNRVGILRANLIHSKDFPSCDVLRCKNYEIEVEKALSPLLFEANHASGNATVSKSNSQPKSLFITDKKDKKEGRESSRTLLQENTAKTLFLENDGAPVVRSSSDKFQPSFRRAGAQQKSGSGDANDARGSSQNPAVIDPTEKYSHRSSSFRPNSSLSVLIESPGEQSNRAATRLSTLYNEVLKEDGACSYLEDFRVAQAQVAEDFFEESSSQNMQKLVALFKRLRKDHEELRTDLIADREKEKKTIEDHISTKERLGATIIELQDSREDVLRLSKWLGLLNFKSGEIQDLPQALYPVANPDCSAGNSFIGTYGSDFVTEKIEPLIAASPLLMSFRQVLLKDFQERTAHLSELHHKEVGTSTTALRSEMQKLFDDIKERENAAVAARENLNEILAVHDRRLTELELTAICRPEFISALKGKADAFAVSEQSKAGASEVSMVERRLHRRLQELEERVAYYEAERKELREIILALLQIEKEGMVGEIRKRSSNMLESNPFPPFPPRSFLHNSHSLSEEEKESFAIGHTDKGNNSSMNGKNVDPNHVVQRTIYRVMANDPLQDNSLAKGKEGDPVNSRSGLVEKKIEGEVTFAAFLGSNSTGLPTERLPFTSRNAGAPVTSREILLQDREFRYGEEGWGGQGEACSSPFYPQTNRGIKSERLASETSLRTNMRQEGSENRTSTGSKRHSAGSDPRNGRLANEGHHNISQPATGNSNNRNNPDSSSRAAGMEQQIANEREMIGLTRNQEAYMRLVTKDFNRNNVNNLPPIPYERRHSP